MLYEMRKARGSSASKKRKAALKTAESGIGELPSLKELASPKELAKGSTKASTRGKRVKAPASSRSQESPEFFEEKRSLEDLWQAAFPIGTEWDNMDKIREINWNFSNLENAFEEGGVLYQKKVYMFGCTEAQLLVVNGEQKVVLVPVVVAVVSSVPPSDKIGIKSVQRETEDIIPMKAMKMAWIPYIPLEERQNQVDRLNTQIYTLGCTQRRSALKHLKIERIKQFDYCLPYLQPLADEYEDDTCVDIIYPLEPPIVCDFDWQENTLEEFTEDLIKEEELPKSQKEAFKEFVREQVRERKRAQREAKQARESAINDLSPEIRDLLDKRDFYKFYPVQTSDTPDLTGVKVPYINRYYGKAKQVL